MGKDPEQLQREIALLREQAEQVASELENRVRDITDVGLQARRHPTATILLSVAAFSAMGLLTWVVFGREEPEPRRTSMADRLSRFLEPVLQRWRRGR